MSLNQTSVCSSPYSKSTMLKTQHREWTLLRELQLTTIPRWLWNAVTESLTGYALVSTDYTQLNLNQPVPSLQYQLYDQLNNTNFRFGLKPGQSFVNPTYALQSILQDLYNPANQFQPMDIGTFFSLYNFNTPANIAIAMDAMYNNFNNVNLNRIFFRILHDALASNSKYAGLMKTSYVSANVVKPFILGPNQ